MHLFALIVLILWVVVLAATLLNLALIPRLRAVHDDVVPQPLVSVIIPARDEARVIERTVRAFLAQRYAALEVIVVDDRSVDGTGAILARIAAEDPRLIVVRGEEPPPGWLGKPAALHRGSQHAHGEILLFVDADVIYAPDAVGAAVAYFQRSGVAMIALLPHFEMETLAEKILMPQLPMAVFSFIPTFLSNRTRLPRLGIGGGPGNMIRRDVYESFGGHEELRDSVVDDVSLARLVRQRGGRTHAVRADDLISIRMYHGFGEVIEGFTKNSFAVFGRSVVVTLIVAVCSVALHSLPYALIFYPPLRVLSLATVVTISLTRLILFRSLRYGTLNALLFHPPMTLIWAYIFLRSMWITGIRGELHWRGRKYDAASTQFGGDRR
jgi:chlorobactene glucosyltransferase